MIPKTEQNVIGNRPTSKPSLTIKTIIKDLQDLEKSLIKQNEVEAMMAKLKKLEQENQKLKTDLSTKEIKLAATERKRKLYYNLFHENVKVLAELKNENDLLKEEIEKSTTGVKQITESSSSSIQSAIPVNETDFDIDENSEPQLAICDTNNYDIEQSRPSAIETTLSSKKVKQTFKCFESNAWKCIICKVTRFDSITNLRTHMTMFHPERYFHCGICPYTAGHRSDFRKHHKTHIADGTDICTLCDLPCGSAKGLSHHKTLYH